MTQTYDDRLDGHSDVDSLMDAAEEIADELGREHYNACYDSEICGACTEDTPISGEWGPWMNKKRTFDNLVQAAETCVKEIESGADAFWVQGELAGTYLDAFRRAAALPEDCVVCNRDVIEDHEQCGHERYGDACPVKA